MIVVTGGAGFIGSNLLAGLNAMGREDILVVDDLTDGKKYVNLAPHRFADYWHYEDFIEAVACNHDFGEPIDAVLHEGACSVTTEWDGHYMMQVNYEFTKTLFHYCMDHKIPFIYASSAAVYGGNEHFNEDDQKQMPLNVYGYSKWLFDQYLLRNWSEVTTQVVGLRYFNVFGPGETHKGPMASVAYHFTNQLRETGTLKLFEGYDGYGAGEQKRDFIYVEDIVKVNLWFLANPQASGIFNLGTGTARTFNDLAHKLIELNCGGNLEYIPFPDKLKGCYQSFTEANIDKLRAAGYDGEFTSLEDGLARYYSML